MVWGGVIDDNVIGPFFFDGKVTGPIYLQTLNDHVLPRLIELGYDLNDVYFQHDGAGPHFAVDVRNWLDNHFPTWIGRAGTINWPARSPDLTIMDFFFWGFIKNQVYDMRSVNRDDLMDRITDAFGLVTPGMLIRAHENMVFRAHMCRNAEGHHFEHLMD